MDIKQILSEQINIEGISQEEIYNLITGTANASLGDFSLPCFRFAKALRKSPVQIANELKDSFAGLPLVSEVQAVNGYLNFFVDNKVMSATVLDEARADNFGKSDMGNGKIRTAGVAMAMQGSAIAGMDVGSATLKLSDEGQYNLIIGAAGEKHLDGLKAILYDEVYLNEPSEHKNELFDNISVENLPYVTEVSGNEIINSLFTMTPYYHRTSLADKEKLSKVDSLTTTVEVDFFILRRT